MAKNLKLNVKNTQLAEAINLRGLKEKLSRKKGEDTAQHPSTQQTCEKAEESVEVIEVQQERVVPVAEVVALEPQEEVQKSPLQHVEELPSEVRQEVAEVALKLGPVFETPPAATEPVVPKKEELSPSIVLRQEESKSVVMEAVEPPSKSAHALPPPPKASQKPYPPGTQPQKASLHAKPSPGKGPSVSVEKGQVPPPAARAPLPPARKDPLPLIQKKKEEAGPRLFVSSLRNTPEKLGPVLDRELPKKPPKKEVVEVKGKGAPLRDKNRPVSAEAPHKEGFQKKAPPPGDKSKPPVREVPKDEDRPVRRMESGEAQQKKLRPKVEESKIKNIKKGGESSAFDTRLRHGLTLEEDSEDRVWNKKRRPRGKFLQVQQPVEVVRPTKISVRIPISVKDLASEMKLKASELIAKLFMQGVVVTLNDILDDELVIQLLGQELGCEITIDTREEERLRITGKTIGEEINEESVENLVPRPPVVTFMGHVDHGKTSLIDAIRKTNRAQHEVGAITQHIGAFRCQTERGFLTIIDTPGHEAFSAMRMRGAAVTDIVILVIAGDEGVQEQTIEALKEAKEAKATVVVAINKSDKPSFDVDSVHRQLADNDLLPEIWGGTTVTVPCSALTGEGIPELLEMISLQAEVLELKANPLVRARGTVIESEMCKGLGPLATVLVQNGTLRLGDSLVFGSTWARVKGMRDENNKDILVAGPSTPVRITGLSGVPSAGEEFIVVKDEKEAREIAEARREGQRQLSFQGKKKISLENMMEKASGAGTKKILNLIVRADVQGSLEAVKNALLKIESKKVEINILSFGIGEISESDLQLASVSKAMILGFHTGIESHAEPMVKELGVTVKLHSIIYHAQDEVKALMKGLLDKIPEEREKGKAEVRALFKSSQLGVIAGCQVIDGTITRSSSVRVIREGKVIWSGPIASLKRFKEDVKEVSKGTECGIVLQGFSAYQALDIFEAFEVVYLEQDL